MKIKYKNKEHVFDIKEKGGVPYLSCPLLERTGLVRHGFSTRLGGVSEDCFSTMNLSFTRGDDPDRVMENYRRMAGVLECRPEDFVCSDQTHTTNIRLVTKADGGKGVVREKDYRDVDGLITKEKGLVLVTFYADCVPLYFYDPVQGAVGLAHSGWRGTVARMGEKMVDAMKEVFGSRPEDLLTAVGPCICQDCYEVSADVAEQFEQAFPDRRAQRELLTETVPGTKYHLNLQRANELILRECSVPTERIFTANLCTCCNAGLLFSHRASKGKRGNLAAFLGLRKS